MSSQVEKKVKRKARDDGRRKDSFISEYFQIKYPHIYVEAIKYHDKLRDFYPQKHDLRKTDHFKRLKTGPQQATNTGPQQATNTGPQQATNTGPQQATNTGPQQSENTIKLNMELKIPLWKTSTLESAQDINAVAEEVLGEGIYPQLLEEVSPECMEQIIDELQQDPDLKGIFTELDVGSEIEIDQDTSLENELS